MRRFEYRRGECRKGTKWTNLKDKEITRLWVIRRYVIVRDLLPNILKWSQVDSHSPPVLLFALIRCYCINCIYGLSQISSRTFFTQYLKTFKFCSLVEHGFVFIELMRGRGEMRPC